MRAFVLVFVVMAGCATDPDPTPTASVYSNPQVASAGIGKSCGDVPCASDLSCVSYYGVAGPQGPLIETCEMTCATDADCPSDRHCVDATDGPKNVCR